MIRIVQNVFVVGLAALFVVLVEFGLVCWQSQWDYASLPTRWTGGARPNNAPLLEEPCGTPALFVTKEGVSSSPESVLDGDGLLQPVYDILPSRYSRAALDAELATLLGTGSREVRVGFGDSIAWETMAEAVDLCLGFGFEEVSIAPAPNDLLVKPCRLERMSVPSGSQPCSPRCQAASTPVAKPP